jgi:hypothetical protein
MWSSRWNENWQGKPKYSEKTCPSVTLSNTNPTWPDLGSHPGCRGGKPATNRLSYGMAITAVTTSHSTAQISLSSSYRGDKKLRRTSIDDLSHGYSLRKNTPSHENSSGQPVTQARLEQGFFRTRSKAVTSASTGQSTFQFLCQAQIDANKLSSGRLHVFHCAVTCCPDSARQF